MAANHRMLVTQMMNMLVNRSILCVFPLSAPALPSLFPWQRILPVDNNDSSNSNNSNDDDLQNSWKNLQHKEQLQRTPVNIGQGPEMCEGGVVVELMGSDHGKVPENARKFAHKPVQVLQVATTLTQVVDGLRDMMGQ